jgi:hypothetical protein
LFSKEPPILGGIQMRLKLSVLPPLIRGRLAEMTLAAAFDIGLLMIRWSTLMPFLSSDALGAVKISLL